MAAKKITSEKEKPKRVRKPSVKASPKTVETSASVVRNSVKGLTTIQDLFKDAWSLFKSTFASYIKVVLIGVGLFIAVGLLGLLIGVPLLISSSGSASELLSEPSVLQLTGIILIILWALSSFVVLYLFFLFLPIASIFIIDSEKSLSIGELFKESKPLILPYFVTSLIMGIIILGGWTLLIIPGILFSLLFSFTAYVVVLEKKTGQEALKRSYQLVTSKFWQVFLRIFAIQGAIFLGTYVLDTLSEQSDIFSLISFVFSLTAGWFAQVYIYLLYKQLKTAVSTASVSLKWVWIVAGIGLILLAFLLYTAWTSGLELLQSPEFMQLMNSNLSDIESA